MNYTEISQIFIAILKHKPNLSRKIISSNWSALQNNLSKKTETTGPVENKSSAGTKENEVKFAKPKPKTKSNEFKKNNQKHNEKESNKLTSCLAIDCEMVGIGKDGQSHMLARVSIVNEVGEVILDKYVKPSETVTDYRTPISGIRPKDIEGGEDFSVIQKEVANIIRGKILVGHALKNDFDVLRLNHPALLIRDTARCTFVKKLVVQNKRTPSLKWLANYLLGKEIQKAEHDSVEDARAVMLIYKKIKPHFEREMKARRYKYE